MQVVRACTDRVRKLIMYTKEINFLHLEPYSAFIISANFSAIAKQAPACVIPGEHISRNDEMELDVPYDQR